MLVSQISLINNSIVQTKVSNNPTNSSNPSFGIRYNWWQAWTVKKFLPKDRRRLYDGEILDAATGPNAQVVTDNLMINAFKEAKAFMLGFIKTKVKRAAATMGSVII